MMRTSAVVRHREGQLAVGRRVRAASASERHPSRSDSSAVTAMSMRLEALGRCVATASLESDP
jgi:hypothetical protein